MTESVKYEMVSAEIEKLAKSCRPGEKLPAIRSMMKEFHASQATIEKSLSILCGKKIIKNIEGRGFFVSEPEVKTPESLRINACFFIKGEISGNVLYRSIAEAFLDEGIKNNMPLHIIGKDSKCDTNTFKKYIQGNRSDAYILLGCRKLSLLHALEEEEIPYVQLYPHTYEGKAPSYIIDNRQVINLAVEHLIHNGRKKISLIHAQGEDNCYLLDQQERIDAFYDIMDEYGLPTIGNSVTFGGFSPEDGYIAAKKLLASRNPPDAIICNDYNALGIYNAIFEKKLKIPQDISVVGIDNIPMAQMLEPKLTTIDINWKEAVITSINKAMDIASGKTYEKEEIRIPVKLVIRKST